MKKTLVWLAIVIGLSACGVSGAPTPAANSSSGGGGGGGGGQATINLTVTGPVNGTTTQLAGEVCSGAQFGAFIDEFKPVIDGTTYDLYISIGKVNTTPVTVDLATQGDRVGLDMHANGAGFRNNSDSTGTINIDAGGNSGSVDVHGMWLNGLPVGPAELKFTFTCPSQ
jgi:hypothetical protein